MSQHEFSLFRNESVSHVLHVYKSIWFSSHLLNPKPKPQPKIVIRWILLQSFQYNPAPPHHTAHNIQQFDIKI